MTNGQLNKKVRGGYCRTGNRQQKGLTREARVREESYFLTFIDRSTSRSATLRRRVSRLS